MMLPINGTVENSARLAAIDKKPQQKKGELTKSIKEKHMNPAKGVLESPDYLISLEEIKEGQNYGAIESKIREGADLSPEEAEFLKYANPHALRTYKEAKKEEKDYEKELGLCETKEDVERLEQARMKGFLSQIKQVSNHSKITESEKMAQIEKTFEKVRIVKKVHEQFVKTAVYASLPAEDELSGKSEKNNFFMRSGEEQSKKKKERTVVIMEVDAKSSEYINHVAADPKDILGGKKVLEKSYRKQSTGRNSAAYNDVVKAVKQFVNEHRQTGAGLRIMQSIQEWEN